MTYCSNCGAHLEPNGNCHNCGFVSGSLPNQQYQKQTDPNAPASGMAVASLVTGILCFFIGGPILAFIATWLGATALNDNNRHGGSVKTESYAKLGRKLGFICIWIWVGFIVLYLVLMAVGFSMFRF